jgi:glyoxylate/hydroxypyruvate reductase A
MILLFCVPALNPEPWRQAFRTLMPDLEFRVWPELGDPEEIDFLFTFQPPAGLVASLSKLKLLQVIGAGVDQLENEPLPPNLPVARTVDCGLTAGMVEYVLAQVLHFHRQLDAYDRFQREVKWQRLPRVEAAARKVGVLGLGPIGTAVAEKMASFGFDVAAWSRTERNLPSVKAFAGDREFGAFLEGCSILVNLLPLTPTTRGILCHSLFDRLARGAYVINVGRGAHCILTDLLAALDSGQLAGAALDVHDTEPLPADSSLWRHPKIRITPHIASTASPNSAAAAVIENIQLVMSRKPPLNRIELPSTSPA